MRFYLEGSLEDVKEKFDRLVADDTLMKVPNVQEENHTGHPYIEVYGDPIGPTTVLPVIPDEMINRVTLHDSIYRGLRAEGLYELGDARLMVTTNIRIHSEMQAYTIEREEWQTVEVSAPTVDSLVEIYRKFRSGKLPPSEDWEAPLATAHLPRCRFFRVNFREGVEAMEAVWRRQDEMTSPRTNFLLSVVLPDASIWTEDTSGAALLRLELQERRTEYEEGDEQQVLFRRNQQVAADPS